MLNNFFISNIAATAKLQAQNDRMISHHPPFLKDNKTDENEQILTESLH